MCGRDGTCRSLPAASSSDVTFWVRYRGGHWEALASLTPVIIKSDGGICTGFGAFWQLFLAPKYFPSLAPQPTCALV